nr:gpi ethanolamine phosphate transferase 2 [Quercus suber]
MRDAGEITWRSYDFQLCSCTGGTRWKRGYRGGHLVQGRINVTLLGSSLSLVRHRVHCQPQFCHPSSLKALQIRVMLRTRGTSERSLSWVHTLHLSPVNSLHRIYRKLGMAARRFKRLLTLAVANALLPIAILVFASGFFPFKPLLPGLAAFESDIDQKRDPIFNRVVFIVVDALRSDFVYGNSSGFAFTQSLIRDGAAIPFTAHAAPPTVTMPRIKAITTGSVPSFADLIFNLDESSGGSSLAGQDTWLAQIRAKGGNILFYGDDTWLRLFPVDGFFLRAEGTSSFFVSVSRTDPGNAPPFDRTHVAETDTSIQRISPKLIPTLHVMFLKS